MESRSGAAVPNWSEAVEDLVHDGDIDGAANLLETTISNLESQLEKKQEKENSKIVDELSTALHDLSKIYSARGFSLRADQTLSRALQIKHHKGDLSTATEYAEYPDLQNASTIPDRVTLHDNNGALQHQEDSEVDDWEVVADRAPEELLSAQSLPDVSKLCLKDTETKSTKRRGRGTFSYKTHSLYSDSQLNEEPIARGSENIQTGFAEESGKRNLTYGTRHVLVLADFPPSTRTTDLEKVLGRFKDLFVIRWVNDTTALAAFRTPSIALEARNSIQCPFTVRMLNEDDELPSSISPKDLEPPRQRPQTSARTAQRLIAQGMGIKLPSTLGSANTEFKRQQEARRNRIISRQNMRDDAWGDD